MKEITKDSDFVEIEESHRPIIVIGDNRYSYFLHKDDNQKWQMLNLFNSNSHWDLKDRQTLGDVVSYLLNRKEDPEFTIYLLDNIYELIHILNNMKGDAS